MKKKDIDFFTAKAREIHGNKYDYSESVYTGRHKKLKILCKTHGEFEVTPGNHYKGQGCPFCRKKIDIKPFADKFFENAVSVHGNKYDYSRVHYKTALTKVEIICKIHGSFFQTPNNHVSKRKGCRLCAIEKSRKQKVPYVRTTPVYKRNKVSRDTGRDNKNRRILIWAKKLKLVRDTGGKCQVCSEDRFWVLCFHHRNPKDKKDNITRLSKVRYEQLLEEAKKCDLLCQNCHRELHLDRKRDSSILNKKLCLEYKNIRGCAYCGYNKCLDSLEFHHTDDTTKTFKISNNIIDEVWKTVDDIPEEVKEELNKCTVLCRNCHQIEHTDVGFIKDNEKEILEKSITLVSKNKIDVNRILSLHKQRLDRFEISKLLKCSPGRVYEILKAHRCT
jgi:hypothetical protein